MWRGLFSSGVVAHIFFFLLSSSSILVGRLSLAKTVLSALRKDALVQKLCIVGTKDL